LSSPEQNKDEGRGSSQGEGTSQPGSLSMKSFTSP
jgi:hypothetical protein